MMNKTKLTLTALALATVLPMLQGCFPAVVGGAAVGVMSAHDRRSTGTQTDDEATEWKAKLKVPDQYKETAHVNFTSYNRRLLITGEVPNDEAKAAIESQVRMIDGVREVYNELGVGPVSSLGSRSTDSFIDSKVKARLVDSNQISANHIKVVTERAIDHLRRQEGGQSDGNRRRRRHPPHRQPDARFAQPAAGERPGRDALSTLPHR
jgi:osmotically-inducible protein OsmY